MENENCEGMSEKDSLDALDFFLSEEDFLNNNQQE